MAITARTISTLRMAANRHSRIGHEAEDLVQDVLLSAIERGRDCSEPTFLPWALGALRNRAAFAARSAARRRRREAACESAGDDATALPRLPEAFISSLPPAGRVVALLINLGMGRAEVTYLLGLSDVAFRQRLTGLRRALSAFGGEIEIPDRLSGDAADGLARRALKRSLPPMGGRAFAIRDPDGVPIFFSRRDHVSGTGGN